MQDFMVGCEQLMIGQFWCPRDLKGRSVELCCPLFFLRRSSFAVPRIDDVSDVSLLGGRGVRFESTSEFSCNLLLKTG